MLEVLCDGCVMDCEFPGQKVTNKIKEENVYFHNAKRIMQIFSITSKTKFPKHIQTDSEQLYSNLTHRQTDTQTDTRID